MKGRRLSTDILDVFGSRAVWTLLGAISGVILARKLGPHDRGILALVLLLPSTVITVSKLGISQANVYFINRKQVSMEQVASNSTTLALVLGLFSMAVVWLFQGRLFSTVMREVEPWALALALVRVPLLLFDDYIYGVLQAAGAFRLYNVRLLIGEALRLVLVVLALMVFHMGLFAAVLIHTVVTAVNIVWLGISTYRRIPFSLRVDRALLGHQLDFGLRSYIQTLAMHLLLRIDVYMVSYYLGPIETAFYSLALRFTEMMLEIPSAVGLVLYPKLATLPEDEVHRLTAQACRRTLLLTGMCAVFLAVLGPYVITLWYGKAYAAAGKPLAWAAVGALALSVFTILTRDFTSQNRQMVNIAAGVPALLLNVGLNIFMIPAMGIVGAAIATAIAYSAACVVLIFFYIPASGLSLSEVIIAKPEDLRFFWQMIRQLTQRGWRRAGLGSVTAHR
ncbi:MAG TPA: flippase [Candidatus Acidoferrales bacterium]|nr:flippase [Candidatus Acidoferrales bacterium]